MEQRLMKESCEHFSELLSAKVSVPGGGGAAAYVGALAAALCSMTGQFTVGKKKYAAYEEDLQRLLAECDSLRRDLLQLVEEDAAAFEPLSKAYAIPKDDPSRAQILEEATKAAAQAPLSMMRTICRVIDALCEMQQKGSVMLMSDVACGATLAGAALQCAALNVYINTKSLMDREHAFALEKEADVMQATYLARSAKITEEITVAMRS
ncbi:MAG: cyclodeaminase/cyclohydrolase family protein [Lachnospiraceae bacterium]|nr:cyclodeaminase/cyclohydrolase family protein [Lachnospiraceae bacterium]